MNLLKNSLESESHLVYEMLLTSKRMLHEQEGNADGRGGEYIFVSLKWCSNMSLINFNK